MNSFTPEVEVLPFHTAHVYYVRPLDQSLQRLLQRWARESGTILQYGASADFSLAKPVENIRSESLAGALQCLQAVYGPHGAEITMHGNTIAVRDIPATRKRPRIAAQSACAASALPEATAEESPKVLPPLTDHQP